LSWSWPRFLESLENFQGGAARDRIGARPVSQTVRSQTLGADFDFARIDLYLARGRAWFGEITHYEGSACVPFAQPEYDRIIGDMWQLPRPIQ
jgi:hypothetical protein